MLRYVKVTSYSSILWLHRHINVTQDIKHAYEYIEVHGLQNNNEYKEVRGLQNNYEYIEVCRLQNNYEYIECAAYKTITST